ncbi:Pkinase-domain-containing protein [Dacryopinax primogenitus]|uniref:Mitogen-activated protein kinase n=1 Tax=Dacryopinax primogenitus (strain DJM 731) TaxID=1858805 RepID=M5G600_DACPD|nr:Pkinase-domain-containing protein [Dacryopinax primogenitus]EJU03645.1 Pkinase-domain-containing protein [Dacryopinax primogenitus]
MDGHKAQPSSPTLPREDQAIAGSTSKRASVEMAKKDTPPVQTPTKSTTPRDRTATATPTKSMSPDYHSFTCSSKTFVVEKRWKLVRELGQGAYGIVVSAQDQISNETVAIKMVTRLFDKLILAKRALREITLLRHFAHHENITGVIDMDVISQDFNEIYLFLEPMEADLHQIIRSGQKLTNAHVQYFLYQILRGVKYIHSANVVHRDIKPGNLLVNADCELKICDFGLSRGFNARADENTTQMTEYVATRWYRAPEVMLSFKRYSFGIDLWSIGCVLGELVMGKPVFKGKDYVDQLNLIINTLGTPPDDTIKKIGSDRAREYVRNLPFKLPQSLPKLFPRTDNMGRDLIHRFLRFDPDERISVNEALAHPFLETYHDEADEPTCPHIFNKWERIETLESMDDFRQEIYKEVEEFRKEVRMVYDEPAPVELLVAAPESPEHEQEELPAVDGLPEEGVPFPTQTDFPPEPSPVAYRERLRAVSDLPPRSAKAVDPYTVYARRSSIIGFSNLSPDAARSPTGGRPPLRSASSALVEDIAEEVEGGEKSASYFIPARHRSISGSGESLRPALLRQLSTISIHDMAGNAPAPLPGVPLAAMTRDVADDLKQKDHVTQADAPASEMPLEFKTRTRSAQARGPFLGPG